LESERFVPAALVRLPEPFDHPDFIYELKYDGFRTLAHTAPSNCVLVSRNGNVFKAFQSLRESLRSLDRPMILDGEIVNLDSEGRPQFYETLRRRGEQILYAFDILQLNGIDLRLRPLLERKEALLNAVAGHPGILPARHVEERGCDLFRLVCEQDLEGIVAKHKTGCYGEGWFKIRNSNYSQYEGRHELFRKRMAARA
jgi:bifunctional non-homologous end joining protein LigD